jgi:hypothetical protein
MKKVDQINFYWSLMILTAVNEGSGERVQSGKDEEGMQAQG